MYDIYSNDSRDAWRYSIGKSGERMLLVVGLNPSTATKEKSDPTIARVEHVANMNGYDGFVMLNLYPVRGTDPGALPNRGDEQAYMANFREIESILGKGMGSRSAMSPTIWAAWGEGIMERDYFIRAAIELSDRLQKHGVKWVHWGAMTRSGHPRHPSRLSYDWKFSSLDMARYAHSLRDAE